MGKVYILLFLLIGLTLVKADDPYIFVTSEDGFLQATGTTLNQFDATTDVFLNVGKLFCFWEDNSIAEGTYYFQVTDSTGKVLSTDQTNNRKFTVSDGAFDDYSGDHLTGTGPCGGTSIQLAPFTASGTSYTVQISTDSNFKKSVISTTFTVKADTTTTGWTVSYYSSAQTNVRYNPSARYNSPALQLTTQTLNFASSWSLSAFGISLKNAYFGAVFTATLTPPADGTYTFTASHKDGARLWIDGAKIFEKWSTYTSTQTTKGSVALKANVKYQFVLEYFNTQGTPVLRLQWNKDTGATADVPASAFSPSNTPFAVKYSNTLYATLDDTHPETDTKSTQKGCRSAAKGYTVATTADASTVAVQSQSWGADCLVTDTGDAVPTKSTTKCGKCGVKKSTVGSNTYYSITPPASDKTNTYKLLTKCGSATTTTTTTSGNDYATIGETVIFNKNEYGCLDGSDASDDATSQCPNGNKYFNIPPGWGLVPASQFGDAAVVAASFAFGANGLVLGDGTIVNTASGAVVGFNGLDSSTNYYRAKASTSCNRVLITRSTTKANTWGASQITQYLSDNNLDYDYATLDNTNPLGAGTAFGCPKLAQPLPEGWTVAKKNAKFESYISQKGYTFGTVCLTYDDGTGYLTIPTGTSTDRTSTCGTLNLKIVNTLSKVANKRQQVSGAIWTSNFDGSQVNGNIYEAKEDVYLNGGPTKCNAGKGLPDGDYYFQVTDPAGKVILSVDTVTGSIEERRVTVKDGKITANKGTHKSAPGSCGQVMVQLVPYLDTPNPGGEYKAWMTPVDQYDVANGRNVFGFDTASSKTDNFKIRTKDASTSTGNYYAVRECSVPRRILIQKTKPAIPSPTGTCGTCVAWGDPHITTYWGGKYNFFGTGFYTYAEPINAPKNWTIYGYLSQVKTASANTQLIFVWGTEIVNFSVPAVAQQVSTITVKRNGAVVSNPNTESGKAISIFKAKESQYTVSLPNGIVAKISLDYWNMNMLTLTFDLPNSLKGATQGLCGTCGDICWKIGSTQKCNITGNDQDTYGKQWKTPSTPTAAPTTPSYTPKCETTALTNAATSECKKYVNENNTRDFENCILDYCNTLHKGSCGGGKKYQGQENSGGCHGPKDQTNFCPVSTVVTQNITTFLGKDFATLDFTHPNDKGAGAQLSFLSPPDGWKIAEDHPHHRALVTCSRFGTTCITFAEGTAVSQSLQKCASNNIQTAEDDCWKPLTPTGRILITRDIQVSVPNPTTDGSGFTTVSSSASNIGKGYQLYTTDGKYAGAKFTIDYNSDDSFSISAWSRSLVPTAKAVAGQSTYGFQVDVIYASGSSTPVTVGYAYYDITQDDWNQRWVDVYPTKTVAQIVVTVKLNGWTGGKVIWSDIKIAEGSEWGAGNMVDDPTVQFSSTSSGSPWIPYKGGFTFADDDNTAGDASGSIQLSTPAGTTFDKANDYGAFQVMELKNYPQFSASGMTGIYFRGDAKVTSTNGIDGTYGAGFSIYVDVLYENDKDNLYGITAQFRRDIKNKWQTAERYAAVDPTKKVRAIQIVALFRKSAGTALFDNIYLTPLYCTFPYPPPTEKPDGCTYGDPHLATLDGHAYDCQLMGDFILAQDPHLTIVTRHSRALFAAVNSITSFIYGGLEFTFERNRDTYSPFLTINGKLTTLEPGMSVSLPGGRGTIIASGSLEPPLKAIRYDIDLPQTEHHVTLTANVGDYKVQWLQVYPKFPLSSTNVTGGLLGVMNGDTSDDFTDVLGRVVPIDSDLLTIYREFAWGWKLTDSGLQNQLKENNLVEEELPTSIIQISDFASADVTKAEEACVGIALYESCVLDVLMSGDAGYANGYNSLERIQRSSDASKPLQSSVSEDGDSMQFRDKVIIIVFSVLGGLLIVGAIVAIVIYRQEQKSKREAASSTNANLVN